MFASGRNKLATLLNKKLEEFDLSITDIDNCSEKGVFSLKFAVSENGGSSIGFLLDDKKGYISFNQLFDKVLFPKINEHYKNEKYPQIVIIIPNSMVDTVSDELSDRHLFPIIDSLDEDEAIIIVRKKDIISYYDKHSKEFEELNKIRAKRVKNLKNKLTLASTFSKIYSKFPIIILTITFLLLFSIFFYDNFINVEKPEQKPKVSENKVLLSMLKKIGTQNLGDAKLTDILLTQRYIQRGFIIRHAKESDRYIILKNFNTPKELIEKAVNSEDENERISVSLNQNLSNDNLLKLANDKSLLVRANLASNPIISEAIMLKLSKDNLVVQEGLFENTALTEDIYKLILKGRSVDCELNKKVFASFLTSSAELSFHKDSSDICIRLGVSLNRNLPYNITEKFIDDEDRAIRNNALLNGKLSKPITDRYFNKKGVLPEGKERSLAEERVLILLNPNLDKEIYQSVFLDAPYTDGLIIAKRQKLDNETLALLTHFAESFGGIESFIQSSKAILNNKRAIIEIVTNNPNDKLAIIRYIKREVNNLFIRNFYNPYILAVLLSKYKIYADYDNLSYIDFSTIDITLDDSRKLPINFSDNRVLVDKINLLDKSEKITFETIKLADNITYGTTVFLLPLVKNIMTDNKLGSTQAIDDFINKASVISTEDGLRAFIIKTLKPLNNFYE